ncbi:MAG TPA: hypothetical protein DDZ51_21435 [Planctomycetaceae bacterium]|nr:hypothetical protein [Planctomycetaceae bacterium]
MQKITKSISPTNGSRSLLASLGLALSCYLDPNAFGSFGKEFGINLRLLLSTARLAPKRALNRL